MSRRVLSGIAMAGAIALWLCGPAQGLAAQQEGTVQGLVTNEASGVPIGGVEVAATAVDQPATLRRTVTGGDGRFTLRNLPAGGYELLVRRVGFRAARQSVTVLSGETADLTIQLTPQVIQLEEIVATATGNQRRVELGHAITDLRTDSIVETQPITNVGELLQSRAAGVTVLPSGGTTGGGTRIRIRGVSSVSLSNEPVIFMDGVRITEGVASSTIAVGGQLPSRLNDLNPEDIESIEIVKGPAAATLYGTDAANGVIVVQTKRGTAGRARWRVYAERGIMTDRVDYPTNFAGFGRALVGGVPTGGPIGCTLNASASGTCVQDSVTSFNVLENEATTPLDEGFRGQYGASVSGGSENVGYYVAGEYENEVGTLRLPFGEGARLLQEGTFDTLPDYVVRPNALRKVSLRTNLNAAPTQKVDLQVNVGFISSRLRLPQNDNNVLGMLPSGYFGKANVSDPAFNGGYGFFRPGEIFSLLTEQNAERFTGSTQAIWRPLSFLRARAVIGLDLTNRIDIGFNGRGQGPQFATVLLGDRNHNRTSIRTYTGELSATAEFHLRPTLSSRTTAGGQYYQDVFFGNFAAGEDLPAGGQSIGGAGILTARDTTADSRTVGGFLEQQFGYKERLYVTGAFRVDDNSSFGTDFNAIFYPKASVSYFISDEPFFPRSATLSTLRLRGAYGQSGRQPRPLDALNFLRAASRAVDGSSTPAVTDLQLGFVGLKPERSAELELGLDAGLFQDRLSLEVTYYNKLTKDALIARTIAPSVGASRSRVENLGSVRNYGLELGLNAQVITSRSFAWDVTLNAAFNKNNLRTLGEGVPPILVTGDGTQRHVPGSPLGGFWDRPISFSDANGDGIIAVSEIAVGDTAVFLGSAIPQREISLNTAMSLFNGLFRIGAQADYRGAFKQFNNTEAFRCVSTGNNCRAMFDQSAPLDEQARAVARRFHPTFTRAGYIEDSEFVKLRELSLTFNAPAAWAGSLRADRLSLTLAARNLFMITDYTGPDPEVQSDGQDNFITQDFLTLPPVRTFILRANLGF